jgi:hypothetical protein
VVCALPRDRICLPAYRLITLSPTPSIGICQHLSSQETGNTSTPCANDGAVVCCRPRRAGSMATYDVTKPADLTLDCHRPQILR